MLHQLRLNSLDWLPNVLNSSVKVLTLFIFSLVISACGSGQDEGAANKAAKSVPDGEKPTLIESQVVNKCNYEKSVGPGNTILLSFTASESIMKPTVTVAGNEVNLTGQHRSWTGEYNFDDHSDNGNPTVEEIENELLDFIVQHNDLISRANITYQDSYNSIAGENIDSLSTALINEYEIQISTVDKENDDFLFFDLFERVLAKKISSYLDIKTILLGDSALRLDPNATVTPEQKEALKDDFYIVTTQAIESNLETPFDWVNKIQALEIPVIISYSDTSGVLGEISNPSSKESLRFCEDGVCQCFPDDISGNWRIHRKPGGMGVGRAEGDIGDWSTNDFTVTERDCLYDDTYTFKAEDPERPQLGAFSQSMDGWTWLEPWQSPNGVEECGDAQAPFDGSTPGMQYDWNVAEGTLTLSGYGAHIGLPRVTNNLENTGAIPVNQPTVYKVATASNNLIVLNILSAGPSPWWHFELERIQDDDDQSGSTDNSDGTENAGNSGAADGVDSNASGGAAAINGASYQDAPFDMSIAFGAPILPTVAGDGDIFTVPADAGDPTAPQANTGFAYNFYYDENGLPDQNAINPLLANPLTFGAGGAIAFEASVPSGGSADVYFKLERLPYDEADPTATEPSYTTDTVTVSGSGTGFYSFEIPSQYGSTFSNFILYLATPDVDVKINNITVYVTDVSSGDVQGPFDMTLPFGDAAIVPNGEGNDPYYVIDSSQGIGFAGFAYNFATAGYETNPLLENPLTFGDGGVITFTASVPSGQPLNTADIRFRFEKEASETGDLSVTEPSCNSAAVTIQDSYSKEYEIAMPIQADRTFSNIVMYIDTPDTNILISDIRVVTTPPDATAEAVSCGLDLYGRQGPLDMTGPYGDAAIIDNGEGNDPYYSNIDGPNGFAGFANLITELYPFEFGEGGTLEFTAFVPEGQSESSVQVDFQLQKQSSLTAAFCDLNPLWDAPTQTVSGSVPETFTIPIPPQGGNTFSNMIMEITAPDGIEVSITDVFVTTTEKTDDAPTVPEQCGETPPPSVYLDENGVNTAALFSGTFDGTIQNGDVYTYPTAAQSWAGFANENNDLYPIDYGNVLFFESKSIVFCASANDAATVYFRFENKPYPNVEFSADSTDVSIIPDGAVRAYESIVTLNHTTESFLLFIEENDVPVTLGKVKGNWNDEALPDIVTDSNNDGIVDYCDDFPNDL